MHPLHKLIGDILTGIEIPDCKVILDKACGGDQWIQLFCGDNAARRTRYCAVDAAILKNNEVKVIVEIEESDIRPVAVCGKAFISAISSHFIHKSNIYPMADRVSFVQVIDTRKLSPISSKFAQLQFLSESIGASLTQLSKHIRSYQIFYGDVVEFRKPEAAGELVEHIRQACL
jgi:hypothetical protein